MMHTADCMLGRLMQFKAKLHDKGKAADSLLMAEKKVILHYPSQCSTLPVRLKPLRHV